MYTNKIRRRVCRATEVAITNNVQIPGK